MSSSLLKLTLPELISLEVTSPELAMSEVTSSELASPELLWSELPLPELVPYETACLELNLMSSHLSKDGLPKFASPIKKGYSRMDDRGRWEAAIWECIPYTKIPRLPPELTDLIIDFVGGDPDPDTTKQKILYNCALDLLYINTNFFKALVRASRTPSYPYAAALRAVQVIILCDAEPTWVHQFPLILGRMFSAVQELHIKDLHWDKVVIHPRTLLVAAHSAISANFGASSVHYLGCKL
ncbi:hypothetical protein SCP_0705970 [Sparassis crispa]|uniref:Uncharacterized protein n=1 Tax=Sparassis crispa TaxID=139825 RepID=A0A401GTA3_9APHY|nr:hypothetical protein SCP_0705970 [Sparassis crispa]GBE85410.1 hypothetical protein SCP_0705970 [Sparassis crispa]